MVETTNQWAEFIFLSKDDRPHHKNVNEIQTLQDQSVKFFTNMCLKLHVGISSGQDSLIVINANLQCLIYYSDLFLATLLFMGMSNTNLIIWKKVVQLEGGPNSFPNTRRRLALAGRILFWEFSSELLIKQIIKVFVYPKIYILPHYLKWNIIWMKSQMEKK